MQRRALNLNNVGHLLKSIFPYLSEKITWPKPRRPEKDGTMYPEEGGESCSRRGQRPHVSHPPLTLPHKGCLLDFQQNHRAKSLVHSPAKYCPGWWYCWKRRATLAIPGKRSHCRVNAICEYCSMIFIHKPVGFLASLSVGRLMPGRNHAWSLPH